VTITGNGSLDPAEVQQFAAKIGLKLSMAEAEEAVSQMELTEKKDGVVEFDEFWHWFTYASAQIPCFYNCTNNL
jgi:Ca2+-binding EF-hand superfamily protein